MTNNIKRQVAYKVKIADIVNGKYVKEEGWKPNYVEIGSNNVSRVNIIATVVAKTTDIGSERLILDDGTGKISARTFGENKSFNKINIGDVVLFIGRPREYNGEKYLVPEIVKLVKDSRLVKLRKIELKLRPFKKQESKTISKVEVIGTEENSFAYEKILKLVRQLDSGSGVEIEDIIIKSNLDNAERIISNLVREGELFEIRPGRLKLL